MPPKKTITFHPDTIFIEKPKEEPKEDPAESELIEAVYTNALITAKWLIISKNIRDQKIDEIVVVAEHYKAEIVDRTISAQTTLEYTLLDVAIIYGHTKMAQLLLTYGARAISHFIKDDPDFLSILTQLKAFFIEKLGEKSQTAKP